MKKTWGTLTHKEAALLAEVLMFVEDCGYGGSNTRTANSHARQLRKLLNCPEGPGNAANLRDGLLREAAR